MHACVHTYICVWYTRTAHMVQVTFIGDPHGQLRNNYEGSVEEHYALLEPADEVRQRNNKKKAVF